VLVLDAGEEIALGAPDVVFKDPKVREAYFEAPGAAA
jgi:ABC-type branched-subunit amino acid transport system ATPase component